MAPLLRLGVCFLLLVSLSQPVPVGAEGNEPALQRQKREWIIAPRKLKENHDYTGLDQIARIRSDKEHKEKVFYEISGPGVDEPPLNVFSVNPNNGYIRIHSILDREQRAEYIIKGIARYKDGTKAEGDIDVRIIVEDENDCPPVFKGLQKGSVAESSAVGTVVMKAIATDADEPNTPHSNIFYSIVEESNTDGFFSINSQTGEIMVRRNTLDRETKDTYKLVVRAADMLGQKGAIATDGEVEIKLLDINDNIPVLEKETYEGSVQENTVNVEVLRIKATDMDMIHTDNWLAVYEIVSGNEAGYFSITTDSKTNEGILMIRKPLDYEVLKFMNLGVVVSNKAKYNFQGQQQTIKTKPYPIKINVINEKEGPRFHPGVKVVTLSEDHTTTSLHKIITNYAAIDSDTLKTATNVRYAKIKDEDNWLIIDEKTADIKLNKLPDRESKFLINGTYYAKIICITNDSPSKTATGTVAIQVEDFNDHCPQLTTTTQTMCLEDNVVYVTAVDEDEYPNAAPFEFTVIEGSSKGKWTVEHLNDTTAILRDQASLWPGIYQVAVEVKDQQGKSCADVQMMDVTVCTCDKVTKTCGARRTSSASVGTGGILLPLLGLLLLLLVPLLLLFCLCGGAGALGDFKPIPFDTKQQLIQYHTEGQGEDKAVPLLNVPVEIDSGHTKDMGFKGEHEYGGAAGGGTMTAEELYWYHKRRQMAIEREEAELSGAGTMGRQEHYFSQYKTGLLDEIALSDQFLGEYYSTKVNQDVSQSKAKDGLLVYDYEGQGSLAGSVGCCSNFESDDDLAFLNDLGPKFKTLAEICQRSTKVTESVDARISVAPHRPVSPVRPSTNTHVYTHTETVRDRDRVNINTVDTSNVATGSSTIVQETITERSQASVPKVNVQDKIMIPSQTLLVQQPTMYYATTPMYVVEPQTQPQVLLVAGNAQQQVVGQVGQVGQLGQLAQVAQVGQVGQVGLSQGLVQVGGLQGTQGVVLVDRQVGMNGVTGQIAQALPQGTLSRSTKVLVVENGSTGGEQSEHFAQRVIQTGQGSTRQGFEVKVPSFSVGSLSSPLSDGNFSVTTTPKLQGSQKVVVQRKKVSVTERKTDSNTRA